MKLAWTLALRELRGGLSGLRLLFICLLLGVSALAGVGSLASSIGAALSSQGQAILGGDLAFTAAQREADGAERAAMDRLGTVSGIVTMRAMATRPDGADSLLVELKGVDDAYPLYGKLTFASGVVVAVRVSETRPLLNRGAGLTAPSITPPSVYAGGTTVRECSASGPRSTVRWPMRR